MTDILQQIPVLSLILLSPLAGLFIIWLLPQRRIRWLNMAVIVVTLIPLALSLLAYAGFDRQQDGVEFTERFTWAQIPLSGELQQGADEVVFHIEYALGVDGLSLPLVVLTALITAMAAFAAVHIKKRQKAFYVWFLLLETGMLCAFLSRDVFLFFIGFELTMVAMYFLIGVWGYGNRERAANHFLIFNGLGSALLLIALVVLVSTAGFRMEQAGEQISFIYSGSYEDLLLNIGDPLAWVNRASEQLGGINPMGWSNQMQWTLFILLIVAFGIKLPIFPFHTWMLKVHTEASPAIVMIHSGVLLKIGAYGLLRFGVLLFPEQAADWAFVLAVLGVINLLYGALLAFRQQELKLVLAYSSISHMGLFLLGIAAFNEAGLHGAVFQLISHGLISSLLFLIVGSLYERTRTTELDQLGGLTKSMPFLSGALLLAGFASLGLPGLSGFVGELLALLGLFETMPGLTAAGVAGIVLTAAYVLRALIKITFGPQHDAHAALRDARLMEAVPIIVLVSFIVLLGCYPSLLTDTMQMSLNGMLELLFAIRTGG